MATANATATSQTWDPERYDRFADFMAEMGSEVLDLLAPVSGERILDLGCGNGVLSGKLAAAGASVVGVDASPELVAAARDRGLDARVADARSLPFEEEFDAVFSNAVLHWIRPPEAVLSGVWRALKPGGRFVAEMGGKGNVVTISRALIAALGRRGIDARAELSWFFPDVEEYAALLGDGGFRVVDIGLFEKPSALPDHIAKWLETFAENLLSLVPPDERPAIAAEVYQSLSPDHVDTEGRVIADYVRLRFHALKQD